MIVYKTDNKARHKAHDLEGIVIRCLNAQTMPCMETQHANEEKAFPWPIIVSCVKILLISSQPALVQFQIPL
jgi:hypothetical protein